MKDFSPSSILILLALLMADTSQGISQQCIGICGGLNFSKFYDYSNDIGYNSKYKIQSGYSLSGFYETYKDSSRGFIFNIQYQMNRAEMEIENISGFASYFKRNSRYTFHQVNLSLNNSHQLFKMKGLVISFIYGPSIGIVLNSSSEGYGSYYVNKYETDSNGSVHTTITEKNWTENTRNSEDLSRLNYGLEGGFIFNIRLNNNSSLIIQNKYNFILSNVCQIKNLKYTSFLTGYVNFGYKYIL